MAAGTVSYLGPFTAEYRTRIANGWVQVNPTLWKKRGPRAGGKKRIPSYTRTAGARSERSSERLGF